MCRLSVSAPIVPKKKPKGGWRYGKPGRRGRPLGSKKLGKGGGMNTNTSAGMKRRGRPPKEKGQSEGGYIDSPTSYGKATENENSGGLFFYSILFCLNYVIYLLLIYFRTLSLTSFPLNLPQHHNHHCFYKFILTIPIRVHIRENAFLENGAVEEIDKLCTSNEWPSYLSSFWVDYLPAEEEGSSASRVHRSHNKKDARRSPRATGVLSSASNTKTLPLRSTRARTLTGTYTQSDEEDISGDYFPRCCFLSKFCI